MDKHIDGRHRLWYGAAALVLVLGCLAAAILIISTLTSFPSLIKDAYKSQPQKIEVPGETTIDLRRKGAYGVYYETARVPAEGPPVLDCRLTSSTTGSYVPLVPDYVPTNRYETKDARVGVLIYSTTIENPGLHTLSCNDPDGRVSSEQVLTIGPNYYFEFLRVAWNMGGSLLGGAGILCGSFVLALGIAAIAQYQSRSKRQVGGGLNE